MRIKKYNPQKIEKKWQKEWSKKNYSLYHADNNSKKKSYYCLIEFPYPSGNGLHIGHIRSNTAMDIIARKRRMQGYNVLYPIGWDAFGLPTEQYAIKNNIAPQKATKDNIKVFKKQLQNIGFSFDWQREINTTDPNYYKWTEWLFLQFYKKGLAKKKKTKINWCPNCKIGLANEESIGGTCERCGSEVTQKEKSQWVIEITKYADKLLKGLNDINFLEEIKTQQRNWIGRSEGRLIKFPIKSTGNTSPYIDIEVFTTRPDTLNSVTFLSIAPEHPLVLSIERGDIVVPNSNIIKNYGKKVREKTDRERLDSKEKSGILIEGIEVINPLTKESIPLFVADYILGNYGRGAVMGVPAYDERDFDFANALNIPIKNNNFLEEKDYQEVSEIHVEYKLRDWIFSRQRYWGEPIPIIFCDKCGEVPVKEKDLPILLPKVKNYSPSEDGDSPLASISSFVNTKCPNCGEKAKRETDTMPNWAGSSWYFLRYIDPNNKKNFADKKLLKKFLPVSWYNGGMEHTTLHLLYSRFWHQFFYDIGLVPTKEPYQKRTAHGLILGEGGQKMSKSRGNVVNPDVLVKEFGADSLRLYEMFMGPFRDAIPWDSKGIIGIERFLNRVFNLFQKIFPEKEEIKKGEKSLNLDKVINSGIKKISDNIESLSLNTAVSELMILSRELDKESEVITPHISYFEDYLKLLFPFAPHIAQELWSVNLKKDTLLDFEKYPKEKKIIIKDEKIELIIQIMGRTRGTIFIDKELEEGKVVEIIQKDERFQKFLNNKIKKVIYVKGKIINIIY